MQGVRVSGDVSVVNTVEYKCNKVRAVNAFLGLSSIFIRYSVPVVDKAIKLKVFDFSMGKIQ